MQSKRPQKGKGDGRQRGLSYRALASRKSWKPLPPVTVLAGSADFLKGRVVERFSAELFGDGAPEVRRFECPQGERQSGGPSLANP